MAYVDGFLLAVQTARKADYLEHARKSWPIFQRHGAIAAVECWGDDVPEGKLTSFPLAVRLEPGEEVVMGWIEWPDKATRDACWATMETDPAWAELGEMPFDGKRMIYGGFQIASRLT